MKPSELSYIDVSSAVVIKHCELMIEHIKQNRNKNWAEEITKCVQNYNNNWWNKLWKKTMSRTEAEIYLKNDDDLGFSTYYWTMERDGETQMDICINILNLCNQSTNGIIHLTTQDGKWIGL